MVGALKKHHFSPSGVTDIIFIIIIPLLALFVKYDVSIVIIQGGVTSCMVCSFAMVWAKGLK
jgi:hypothetical protein